jgi:hypothetical protein
VSEPPSAWAAQQVTKLEVEASGTWLLLCPCLNFVFVNLCFCHIIFVIIIAVVVAGV